MCIDVIDNYFNSKSHKVFLMSVGDDDYNSIMCKLPSKPVKILRVSDFCVKDDKKPNLDSLFDYLMTADISHNYTKIVVIGLGEYLALEGYDRCKTVLMQLMECEIGNSQVVALLRGVSDTVRLLVESDIRIQEMKDYYVADNNSFNVSLELTDMPMPLFDVKGIKNILRCLEDGVTGCIKAQTVMVFEESIVQLKMMKSSYKVIVESIGLAGIQESQGTSEEWDELLKVLTEYDMDINELFISKTFPDFHYLDFHRFLYELKPFDCWLFYIYLLYDKKKIANSYLVYELKKSHNIDDFKDKILCGIIDIKLDDKRYWRFYEERKGLLMQYHDTTIAGFINKNKMHFDESVYRLTDNTMIEKEEIIKWISKYESIPNNLEVIYPELNAYLQNYAFRGDKLNPKFADDLSRYFDKYKKLKVFNYISDDFLDNVNELAEKRVYNRLPNRDELVKKAYNKTTQLFWVDALGVEYLSYIDYLARKENINMSVQIGRCDLPSLTSINNNFFNEWPEEQRYKKESRLDDIKHNNKGDYYFENSDELPVHIASELEVIKDVMKIITTTLNSGSFREVVLSSDHGTSRLAVIHKQEEKYKTDTKGEHSGRCCKYFSGCDLKYAIKEKERGYIVLADYGRFKGSRAANTEVHGGASLEEVVVPVIRFSSKDNDYSFKVVTEEIKADYKNGIQFDLYVNKMLPDELRIGYGSKFYEGEKISENNYRIKIPDIKKAKDAYILDVYIGEKLSSRIEIKVTAKSASINDDFDDLFN